MSEATVKLEAVERGDPGAAEELFVLLYAELRRNAAVKLARELPGQTLQPTALVHEAWIRLVGDQNPGFSSRAHFFHAASEAMRRILIERARRKRTERHGGRYRRVDLDGFDPAAPNADEHLLAVLEVLDKLTSEHGSQLPRPRRQGLPYSGPTRPADAEPGRSLCPAGLEIGGHQRR